MSRLWPHAAYAEDQPYAKTVLRTHTTYRGFQAGALVGAIVGGGRQVLGKSRASSTPSLPLAGILRSAGVGAVVGTGVLAVMTELRMYGRQPIEWADRSWRLLENRGQLAVDDWSLAGAAMTLAVLTTGARRKGPLAWKGTVGGLGLGSLLGTAGYMVWRYGVRRDEGWELFVTK
ncbi:MAG: hypothetical protein M1818_001299 [Claussenomyces sp. TS43310]|nr:MAG: hypothetical protein M1818_001299 [Claussenomyces sp. TS43310]